MNFLSFNADRARRRPVESADDVEQRRLSGAGRPGHRCEFSGCQIKINTAKRPGDDFVSTEVFCYVFYLNDFYQLFVKGLSLRLGRQNLIKGEGFLILEGNPWDGSRSIYHNAAVLAYERGKSKLELIGIFDPRMDRYLPRINDKHRQLVEWNESALGAYYTDTRLS